MADHVGAYRRLSVSNLPTRWTLVRKGDAPPLVRQHVSRDRRGRLGLTSAGCVADAIPPEWFPDTPGDFGGASLRAVGARGRKPAGGATRGTLQVVVATSTMRRNILFVKLVVPDCPGMGGAAPVVPQSSPPLWRGMAPVGAGHRAGSNAVLSSPATEGGASPSRPDERTRLEPRAPCYRRGSPGRGDPATPPATSQDHRGGARSPSTSGGGRHRPVDGRTRRADPGRHRNEGEPPVPWSRSRCAVRGCGGVPAGPPGPVACDVVGAVRESRPQPPGQHRHGCDR